MGLFFSKQKQSPSHLFRRMSGHAPLFFPDISMQPRIFLAPMYKITDFPFRKAYCRVFGNTIDDAISPFIPIHSGVITTKNPLFEDISTDKNKNLIPLTPQLLGKDKKQMIDFCKAVQDLGYSHINWNLGCPMPSVTRKKRGSGLLPFPEIVQEVLDALFTASSMHISLKMRLGLSSKTEIFSLMPRLNQYPIEYIVLHPRTGIQRYGGETDTAGFLEIQNESSIPLVYNGEIKSPSDLSDLENKGISTRNIMIGRGILENPFLPCEIKGLKHKNKSLWKQFHDELFIAITNEGFSPKGAIGRMKGYWKYWTVRLQMPHDIIFPILQSQTEQPYSHAAERAFEWIELYKDSARRGYDCELSEPGYEGMEKQNPRQREKRVSLPF